MRPVSKRAFWAFVIVTHVIAWPIAITMIVRAL